MLDMFRRAYAWLTLADYDEASNEATKRIMKRYARGNTSLQNGWFMNDAELTSLAQKGDAAAARLRELLR